MLAARAKSSSTSLALTYPSSVAMKAQRLGQSFMTCPMPLHWWQMILELGEEKLVEAPGVALFFSCRGCTLDNLLIPEENAGVDGCGATEILGVCGLQRY